MTDIWEKHFKLVLTDTYDAEKIKILNHKLMDFNTARQRRLVTV